MPDEAELSVIFVDQQSITDLNERFLGGTGRPTCWRSRWTTTSLLGGRQPDQGGRGPGVAGGGRRPADRDRRCRRLPAGGRAQAPEHGWTTEDEVALLVVHGVLHLLNYDHADRARMPRCSSGSASCWPASASSSRGTDR